MPNQSTRRSPKSTRPRTPGHRVRDTTEFYAAVKVACGDLAAKRTKLLAEIGAIRAALQAQDEGLLWIDKFVHDSVTQHQLAKHELAIQGEKDFGIAVGVAAASVLAMGVAGLLFRSVTATVTGSTAAAGTTTVVTASTPAAAAADLAAANGLRALLSHSWAASGRAGCRIAIAEMFSLEALATTGVAVPFAGLAGLTSLTAGHTLKTALGRNPPKPPGVGQVLACLIPYGLAIPVKVANASLTATERDQLRVARCVRELTAVRYRLALQDSEHLIKSFIERSGKQSRWSFFPDEILKADKRLGARAQELAASEAKRTSEPKQKLYRAYLGALRADWSPILVRSNRLKTRLRIELKSRTQSLQQISRQLEKRLARIRRRERMKAKSPR